MFWQWLVVAVLALVAAVYLARLTWRAWFGPKRSCGGGCSCAPESQQMDAKGTAVTLIPAESLLVRSRQNERTNRSN